MANVNEGLGTPAAGENVNSAAGFESALAEKVGRTEELEARPDVPSTSVADGLVVAGSEAPAPDPDESEVEDEGADTSDDDEGAGGSPELEALLEKHNGNALLALAELEDRRKNAESKIGQQGNDLGKLRRELDELRGEVKARIELAPSAAALPNISSDDLEEMIAENGGMNVALWAVNNRPDLYDKVHKIWRVEEPDEASDFRLDYKLHVQRQELEKATATAAGQPDEWVASQKQQALINQALKAVQDESPDWPAISDHMLAALEQVPQLVAEMVVSEDPAARLDAVRIVADKARILSGAHLSGEAKTKEKQLAVERKRSATVASGSMRPVAPPGSENGEMTSEERQAAFKKALMETETTSVTEGLTYAKA